MVIPISNSLYVNILYFTLSLCLFGWPLPRVGGVSVVAVPMLLSGGACSLYVEMVRDKFGIKEGT